MTLVIAKQKRTIAVSGGALPCTIDLLDGNSRQWVRTQPCFPNGLQAQVFHVTGFTGQWFAGLSAATTDLETISAPTRGNTTTVGTGLSEYLYQWRTGFSDAVQFDLPVWTPGDYSVSGTINTLIAYTNVRLMAANFGSVEVYKPPGASVSWSVTVHATGRVGLSIS
jgi:hypothetical protein